MNRARIRMGLCGAVAVVVMAAAACVPPPPEPATGPNPDDAPQAGVAAYTEAGPYAAGVTTLDLGDRLVEVMYPVEPDSVGGTPKDVYFIKDLVPQSFRDLIPPEINPPFVTDAYRDLPASPDGDFPLVIYSHGFAGYRQISSFMTAHLASWGFVVISPDYLERGLGSVLGAPSGIARPDTVVADESIDATIAAGEDPTSVLSGAVDGSAVYPIGHSAGGGTTLRLLERPDVHSAIPMAAGISTLSLIQGNAPVLPPEKSIMWMGARGDGVAAIDNVRNGFDYTPGERKLVDLAPAGHNVFTDICTIGGGGGLAGLALSIPGLPIPQALLNLGADGCYPPNVDVTEVWPEINHFVTAELRYRSGIDPEPVGLGVAVTSSFDNVIDYRHNP